MGLEPNVGFPTHVKAELGLKISWMYQTVGIPSFLQFLARSIPTFFFSTHALLNTSKQSFEAFPCLGIIQVPSE